MQKIGKFEFCLQGNNVDFTSKATMQHLLRLFIQCASENATENGFGSDYLRSNSIAWVLARVLINMKRLPNAFEILHIETWISGIEQATSERKFAVYDSQNNLIGVASSMWAIIDMNTRKAAAFEQNNHIQEFVVERDIEIPDSERVRCLDGEIVATKSVIYSDLDLNRHVNSAKYIEWIFDTIPLDEQEQNPFLGVLINYQYEVRYGDNVSIRKSQKREHHYDIFREDGANAVKFKFFREAFDI